MKSLILFICLILSTSGFALTIEEKEHDFEQLLKLIESDYGPLQFKKDKYGIDLDDLRKIHKNRIVNSTTDSLFFYELVKIASQFNDSHFRLTSSDRTSKILGISIDWIGDRPVLAQIHNEVLDNSKLPVEIGDELVLWNENRVIEKILEHEKYFGSSNKNTKRRMAIWTLSYRGDLAPLPTSKNVNLTFKEDTTS